MGFTYDSTFKLCTTDQTLSVNQVQTMLDIATRAQEWAKNQNSGLGKLGVVTGIIGLITKNPSLPKLSGAAGFTSLTADQYASLADDFGGIRDALKYIAGNCASGECARVELHASAEVGNSQFYGGSLDSVDGRGLTRAWEMMPGKSVDAWIIIQQVLLLNQA